MKCKHCSSLIFSLRKKEFCCEDCKHAYEYKQLHAETKKNTVYVQKQLLGDSFNVKKSSENLEEGYEDNQSNDDLVEGSSNPVLDLIDDYYDFCQQTGKDY